MEYYIGIDNSSLDHKVHRIDDHGNHKLSFTDANSLEGFTKLSAHLANFQNRKIGFELPHGHRTDYLYSLQYSIYSINQLKIKRYKEFIKVSGNKSDAIDACATAKYLCFFQLTIITIVMPLLWYTSLKGKTYFVAIQALVNKWVKVIFKIWKEKIFYDENKIISVAWHSVCARLPY